MAVETRGTVQMEGDSEPGAHVDVFIDPYRIRIESRDDTIGDWALTDVGVHALNDGFAIRAEGELFVLKTESDALVAEELGLMASTPRLARKVAASHPPEDRTSDNNGGETESSYLLAITFALGGVLVLAGGVLLNSESSSTSSQTAATSIDSGGQFWLSFVIGGALMVAVAYILARGTRLARILTLLVLLGLIVTFALAARDAVIDANHLLAYGFIAGGIVVGVAVVFSESLRGEEDTD